MNDSKIYKYTMLGQKGAKCISMKQYDKEKHHVIIDQQNVFSFTTDWIIK